MEGRQEKFEKCGITVVGTMLFDAPAWQRNPFSNLVPNAIHLHKHLDLLLRIEIWGWTVGAAGSGRLFGVGCGSSLRVTAEAQVGC